MKKICFIITALLSVSLLMIPANAWEISASVGRTGESQTTARIGASYQWDKRWFDSSVGHLTGYWDANYTYWGSGKYSDSHSIAISPVLVYEFHTGNIRPFIEIGVGVAAFSSTHVGDNRLGSAFNFEDRIGLGLKLYDRHTIGLRATHYSNAGIKKRNDGIENYSLYYSLKF